MIPKNSTRAVTFDRDPAGRAPTVEVAHEALIREWGRLDAWLAAGRADLRMQRQLATAAQAWREAGQDNSFLLHGTRLTQFEEWAAQTQLALNAGEQEFLRTGINERNRRQAEEEARRRRELETAQQLAEEAEARRQAEAQHAQEAEARAQDQTRSARRLRWLAAGLAVFLLAAVGAAWFAFNQQTIARASQVQAEANFTRAEAQRLAAEANTLVQAGGNAEVIALLALKSLRTQYSPQGDAALQAAAGLDYPQHILTGHEGSLWAVDYSPDSLFVVTAGADGTARLWDVVTGKQVQEFAGHEDELVSVAFAPDGRTVLTGSFDQTARLWDIDTGKLRQTFTGHTDAVEKVRFSPDGQTLLTAGDDRTARLWTVETGAEIRRVVGHANGVFGTAFAPDGGSIATASFDQTAKLWGIEPQPEWSPLAGVDAPSFANAIKFSADGKAAVGAGGRGVTIWNAKTGETINQFAYGPPLLSVAISPDGSRVWGGGVDGALVGWDANSGELLKTLTGHEAEIVSVAISPDGRYALTAGASDGTARLWDVATGQAVRIFNPEAGFVLDVAFSPDGRHALASSHGGVFMWALDSGQLMNHFEPVEPMGVPSVVVSTDGTQVIAGTRFGEILFFDATNGQQQRVLSGHTAAVRDLTLSPDGRLLLSASADGTARLWDITAGAELRRFNRRPFTIHSVAFAPDGRTVLVAANDGLALRYDVNYQDTVSYLCSRLQRDFSIEERVQYELVDTAATCKP